MRSLSTHLVVAAFAACATFGTTIGALSDHHEDERTKTMELGAFSVSLAVKDLETSRAFYEKLDFKQIAGVAEQNWIILQNGTTTIGLFQGMFERNLMTFNPGWTSTTAKLEEFDDVRAIQRTLKARGLQPTSEADESSTGPASLVLTDPDGNPVLFDQHVPAPGH